MDIIKFKILQDGDSVERVENNEVHVRRKNGDYVVYKLKTEENEIVMYSFDALIITKGHGIFKVIQDADLDDLK
ncbi:hypothetical protein [Paenibacillus sp. V4I5]|uniref:hypothetical protein n=1 Tax=Paenibacillus sp. V4I5 TaxID=3042306 RepID=UPI002792A61C|nr:hypothetical protein [Paenibacillus sp. V4I5]MDQ0917540.1 hypothetical protein [Paenibacillus sp. V4I5]